MGCLRWLKGTATCANGGWKHESLSHRYSVSYLFPFISKPNFIQMPIIVRHISPSHPKSKEEEKKEEIIKKKKKREPLLRAKSVVSQYGKEIV